MIVIARADAPTLGLLHKRIHELWSLRLGSSIGVGNGSRFTPTTCFETFHFPTGLTPADTAHQMMETVAARAPSPQPSPFICKFSGRGSRSNGSGHCALIPAQLTGEVRAHAITIAQAAQRLVALRDAWLNPTEWTDSVPKVIPLGMTTSPHPNFTVAKPGFEKDLAQRTLTKPYNQRPAWLAQAHAALDAAVAAAYGWADYTAAMPDDEILRRSLALNQAHAACGGPECRPSGSANKAGFSLPIPELGSY